MPTTCTPRRGRAAGPSLTETAPTKILRRRLILGELTLGDLVKLEDRGNVQGGLAHVIETYAMAFLASTLLVDQADEEASYVKYWQFLHDRPTWQQAFEDAFGIGIEDFYKAFEEQLPSQISSHVDQVTIQILWPDMETNPPIPGEFLSILMSNVREEQNQPMSWRPDSSQFPPYFTIRYFAGFTWSATVSLWWSDDQITEHLLGWYKDGELTDQPAEATLMKFTGSYSIEWTLPAHPNTLPRLRTETR